jgi:hypothetical protein
MPKAVTILAVIACCCGAVYCFSLSTNSFPELQSLVLSSIPPGYADRFTPSLYHKLMLAARLGSICLLLLGALVLLLRRTIQKMVLQVGLEVRALAAFYTPWFYLTRNTRLYNLGLGIILLLGFLLRLYFLTKPLRKDEANTYLYYANHPLVLGMCYYTAN